MGIDTLPDEDIETARRQIEMFLSRSLKVIDIEPVEAEEVIARTGGGRDTGEFEVCFRLKLGQPKDDEILETVSDMTSHLRDQLEAMERGSDAPDTILLAEDHPPAHIKTKPLVYYIRSVL